MPIRLTGSTREPYWLSLDGFADLRLKVRPLTAETVPLARIKSERQIANLLSTRAELAEIGGDVSAFPDLSDPDQASAFSSVLFMISLGRASIIEWEGVYDEGGAPAKVTDETVAELMRTYPIGPRFRDAYLAEHLARSAEKNGFAPSPAGISASAPVGADAVAPHLVGAGGTAAGGGGAPRAEAARTG